MPLGQSEHTDDPSRLKEPAPQGTQLAAQAPENVPPGQREHLLESPREKVDGGHGVQTALSPVAKAVVET